MHSRSILRLYRPVPGSKGKGVRFVTNHGKNKNTTPNLPRNSEIFRAPRRPIPPFSNIQTEIEGDIQGEYSYGENSEGDIPLTYSAETVYTMKYGKYNSNSSSSSLFSSSPSSGSGSVPSTSGATQREDAILYHAREALKRNGDDSMYEELHGQPASNPYPKDVHDYYPVEEKTNAEQKSKEKRLRYPSDPDQDSSPENDKHPDIPYYNPRDDMYPPDRTENQPYNK